MPVDLDAFFDCRIVWTANDLVGGEPYFIFQDDLDHEFVITLVTACRGKKHYLGGIADISSVLPADCIIICTAPVWHRNFKRLQAAGFTGNRANVLHFLENDPSGYWDFAQACGDDLFSILDDGGLTPRTLQTVAPFVEKWLGGKVAAGRLAPLICLATAEYKTQLKLNSPSIVRIMSSLADDESRTVYSRILFGTGEQILSSYSELVWGPQQYMEIANLSPDSVVVNCGVDSGWELPYFVSHMKGRGKIINFDPNIRYDRGLYAQYIESFHYMIEDHRIILGNQDGTVDLPFANANMVQSGEQTGSATSPADTVTFSSSRLDTLMKQGLADRLDYLKMDVEGGELYILQGAIESIKKYRPKLAVAIYHEPNHFWDYPAYLMDNLEDYRYYVRQYGYSRFETLMYAVPKEDIQSGSGQEWMRSKGTSRDLLNLTNQPMSPVLHLRDKAENDRAYYARNIRPLTRVFGHDWSTAELKPLPQIEADEIVGVFESQTGTIVLTQHAYDSQTVRLTVGEFCNDVNINYAVDRGIFADAVCSVVKRNDTCPSAIVWSPSQSQAVVMFYKDGSIQDDVAFGCSSRPVYGEVSSEGLQIWTLGKDEKTLVLNSIKKGKISAVKTVALNGTFAGIACIKKYIDGGSSLYPAAIVRSALDNDTDNHFIDIFTGANLGLELNLPADMDVVATIVAAA